MGGSRENCIDKRQEPDTETVELLELIEKYPVVILTLLVSPHLQEHTYSNHKKRQTFKPHLWTKRQTVYEYKYILSLVSVFLTTGYGLQQGGYPGRACTGCVKGSFIEAKKLQHGFVYQSEAGTPSGTTEAQFGE